MGKSIHDSDNYAKKVMTFLVPAYNVEGYLCHGLNSILAVDPAYLDRIEVLLVNDGSTDDSSKTAHSYTERYPETVRVIDKENGGYGSVINCGIREARGRYLRLLDGDDWVCTENLDGLLTLLEGTDCDLVLCDYEIYDEVSGRTALVRACPSDRTLEPGRRYSYASIGDIRPSMHGQIFRTELFREHGITIDEHCFYTDTEYVSYPVPYLNSFCYYDRPVYVYRLGREGQSVSAKGWNAHERDHERVIAGLLGEYRGIKLRPGKKPKPDQRDPVQRDGDRGNGRGEGICGGQRTACNGLPGENREIDAVRQEYLAHGLALELEKRFQGYPLIRMEAEKDYRSRLISLDRQLLSEFPEIGGYRVQFPIPAIRWLHYQAAVMILYYCLFGLYKRAKNRWKQIRR